MNVLLYESRASRTLEIVPEFRVVFDALRIGAFYPLASHAGPERAGLVRSVYIENVQTFAAGADRNAALLRVDPTQRFAADPTVHEYVRYFAHALDVGMVPEHYVEYRG